MTIETDHICGPFELSYPCIPILVYELRIDTVRPLPKFELYKLVKKPLSTHTGEPEYEFPTKQLNYKIVV
jgi:hypothetical protein